MMFNCSKVFFSKCLHPHLQGLYRGLAICNKLNQTYFCSSVLSRNLSFSLPALKAKDHRKKKRGASLLEKYLKDKEKKSVSKTYEVWETINAVDLAKIIKVEADDIFELILQIDDSLLDDERQPIRSRRVLTEIAKKLRCKFKFIPDPRKRLTEPERLESLDVVHPPPKLEELQPRPPVCAIVGHIDHGKTTLLDYLRKSHVVNVEFGGITQHIGAFSVKLPSMDKLSLQNITFLDTPGHAAFKTMRIRGAHITDIVILVVDACEGPLEQTLESIRAVKEARVSLIVALNKIDRPEANIEGTKKALYEAGVELEDYGGDVQVVAISALHGTNVNLLIEAILAQAEVLQLAADFHGPVEGTVVESKIEPGLGKTAVVLISRGSLKKGDFLVCGTTYAKVRMALHTGAVLENEKDFRSEMKIVRPSEACRVVGWKELPRAGDDVLQVENEKRAIEVIKWREQQEQNQKAINELREIEKKRKTDRESYNEFRRKKLEAGFIRPIYGRTDFFVREKETVSYEGPPKLSFIVKTDVHGSLEAILECLETYHDDEVHLDLLHAGVGTVTETDLKLAQEFNGIVYSFNANLPDAVRRSATFLKVPVKEFNIIYALIDDLKVEISSRLPHADVEVVLGRGMVLKEFLISEKNKKMPVAGCRVVSGKFDKSKLFKVSRGGQVLVRCDSQSLRHIKDEVPFVNQGQECGLRLTDVTFRFQERDEIVCYEMTKEPRFTSWSPGF